jgi:hypothetical protein
LLPAKALSKVFRAQYFENLKREALIIIPKSRNSCGKNNGWFFPKNLLNAPNQWRNIWKDIPIKLPLATTES